MQSWTELRSNNSYFSTDAFTFSRSPQKVTIAKALGIEDVKVPKTRKTIKIAKTAQSNNPAEVYTKSCKKRDTEKL